MSAFSYTHLDLSADESDHEESLLLIKEISRCVDVPILGGGNIKRMEDVKKLIYAGCKKAFLNFSKKENIELLEEASKRFGRERMVICADSQTELISNRELIEEYASEVLLLADEIQVSEACRLVTVPVQPLVCLLYTSRCV